jgi:hypothetical protein
MDFMPKEPTLLEIALLFARLDRIDDTLSIVRGFDDSMSFEPGQASNRANAFSAVVSEEIKRGNLDTAKTVLNEALSQASQVKNDERRSSELALVAKGFVSLKEYRKARLISDSCLSSDKLSVYASILNKYTRAASMSEKEAVTSNSEDIVPAKAFLTKPDSWRRPLWNLW